MPIDAPVVAVLSKEINERLPLKVDRIFQPFTDEFMIGLFGAGVASRLLISLNSQYGRIHFFDGTRENPANPSSFCMLLRKHYGGAKLLACESVPFERIVKLEFEGYDQYSGLSRKFLWVELTGKSANLILADHQNVIIDAWRKSAKNKPGDRELFPGAPYLPPSTGERWKPVTISEQQFSAILSQIPAEIPLEKFLLKHWYGLSHLAIHEITEQAGFHGSTPCGSVSTNIRQLYDSFLRWSERVAAQDFQSSGLFNAAGEIVDYSAFQIKFPPQGFTVEPIQTMNDAVALVANRLHESGRFLNQKQNVLKKITQMLDKNRNKLAKQETEALVAEQCDALRIAGELLTIYNQQITKGITEVQLSNHYDPNGAMMTIVLNPALSPLANSQVYFKKYQKAKKGQQEIAAQIAKTLETIEYLESVSAFAENSLTHADLKLVEDELDQANVKLKKESSPRHPSKKAIPAEPRRFVTPAGHQVLVGRNNIQNDKLTFKTADPGDIWFHTQKIPGSHVILKAKPGIPLDDESLNLACQIAVYFSKGKHSTKIPVDYTERKNVKKPPGSKPGFVIYDHFKTAIITPDPRILSELGLPPL